VLPERILAEAHPGPGAIFHATGPRGFSNSVCLARRVVRLTLVSGSLEGQGDYRLDHGILQDPVQGVAGARKTDPLLLRAPEDDPVSASDHRAGPRHRLGAKT